MPRVIITVPERNSQPYRFSLDRERVSIGRGSDNDIVIDSGSVSMKHAEMRRVHGRYEIGDLGSTNGIKYLGVRHEKIELVSGMMISLGDVAFGFTLTDEEVEIIARETPRVEKSSSLETISETSEEEQPETKTKSVPTSARQYSGVGIGCILLFLVLAAGAFVTGVSLRHKKETGKSLIEVIKKRAAWMEKVAPTEE